MMAEATMSWPTAHASIHILSRGLRLRVTGNTTMMTISLFSSDTDEQRSRMKSMQKGKRLG